jgi:hypothetical protein
VAAMKSDPNVAFSVMHITLRDMDWFKPVKLGWSMPKAT